VSDRQHERRLKAEQAVFRAQALAPHVETLAPYFAERAQALINEVMQARTDQERAEAAHGLRALEELKAWLRAQDAHGRMAARELEG